MHNRFNHMELVTDQPAEAREFYGAIFNWTFSDMPLGTGGAYTYIHTGEWATGGLMQKGAPQAPNAWLRYVLVDSVASTVTKALAKGGQVVVPRTDVPTGAFAVLADPGRAVFGVFEQSSK